MTAPNLIHTLKRFLLLALLLIYNNGGAKQHTDSEKPLSIVNNSFIYFQSEYSVEVDKMDVKDQCWKINVRVYGYINGTRTLLASADVWTGKNCTVPVKASDGITGNYKGDTIEKDYLLQGPDSSIRKIFDNHKDVYQMYLMEKKTVLEK